MDKSRDDHPLPLDNKLKKRPQSFGAYTRHEEEEEKKECKHEVSRQGKQRLPEVPEGSALRWGKCQYGVWSSRVTGQQGPIVGLAGGRGVGRTGRGLPAGGARAIGPAFLGALVGVGCNARRLMRPDRIDDPDIRWMTSRARP